MAVGLGVDTVDGPTLLLSPADCAGLVSRLRIGTRVERERGPSNRETDALVRAVFEMASRGRAASARGSVPAEIAKAAASSERQGFFNVGQAAARLGISPRRMRQLVAMGVVEATQVDDRWRISAVSLAAEVERRSA